jgi:hypothetical protein
VSEGRAEDVVAKPLIVDRNTEDVCLRQKKIYTGKKWLDFRAAKDMQLTVMHLKNLSVCIQKRCIFHPEKVYLKCVVRLPAKLCGYC